MTVQQDISTYGSAPIAPKAAGIDPSTIMVPEPKHPGIEIQPDVPPATDGGIEASADHATQKSVSDAIFARQTQALREQCFPGSAPEQVKAQPAEPAPSDAAREVIKRVPLQTRNPLAALSLRGRSAEFAARAKDVKPLLGRFCMSGQATIVYAAPNVGKTLISLKLALDAVMSGEVLPGNMFLINGDDNSSGLATKINLADELGIHTLAPGFNGFKHRELLDLLNRAAEMDTALGTVVIIDTVKKFTSLMDKSKSSDFANACRQFVMRGGTILGLAHTNKSPGPDGKPKYTGTADVIEDFDAAYVVEPLESKAGTGERVVRFNLLKRRGDNPDTVAYAYAAETGISYEERLASVREIDPGEIDQFQPIREGFDETPVVDALTRLIALGQPIGKMELPRLAAKECGVSERRAMRVLEKYTGEDPGQHRWRFVRKHHNLFAYELLIAG